jgi:hypothetical protein
MKQLTQSQITVISGAAKSIYYFGGISYDVECPNTSQVCLETFLSYIGKLPPGSNIPSATLNDSLEACGGAAGLTVIIPCLNPIVAKIKLEQKP